jgi:hypothetical protein
VGCCELQKQPVGTSDFEEQATLGNPPLELPDPSPKVGLVDAPIGEIIAILLALEIALTIEASHLFRRQTRRIEDQAAVAARDEAAKMRAGILASAGYA